MKTIRNINFSKGSFTHQLQMGANVVPILFSAPESMTKRLRNCIRGKIPKVDAVRDAITSVEPQEMLRPRDSGEKDEGELTGGKRLVRRLHERYGHYTDVIVADALYLNAPFINTVLECHLDAVIRLKDEKRVIYQDAEKLFEKGEGKKLEFTRGNKRIERWDIEENGFHQLKTYYHAKHCYCHEAMEVIFYLMLIAFNMREMYLYRRIHGFEQSGITRKSVSRIFSDNLQAEELRDLLYEKGG